MKSKNLILAICAFAFAVGSAFAPVADELVYVRAKLTSNPNEQFACHSTGVECDTGGMYPCKVQLEVLGTPKIAGKPCRTGCTTILKSTQDVTESLLKVYQLEP